MKSILGIGNALTDILAVFPDDSMLREYHLPPGSMQHVDLETGDSIWSKLKEYGVKYVPGGSAANTITCTSIFGMPSCFIGKIGNDELGHLYKSTLEQFGVHELVPEDLKPEYFEGFDYFHIEGYLVQNQDLIRKAVQMAKDAGCKISIDMASYNVVESNDAFFHNLVEKYIDIVFANESEARAYTKKEPLAAIDELASQCEIAVVKVGKDGSMVKQGNEYHYIPAWPAATIDATGAGDTYAAGFLYAHSLGMPLKVCGEVGSIIAAKVVEVVGTKIDVPRWRDAKAEIRELIASVNQ